MDKKVGKYRDAVLRDRLIGRKRRVGGGERGDRSLGGIPLFPPSLGTARRMGAREIFARSVHYASAVKETRSGSDRPMEGFGFGMIRFGKDAPPQPED